MLPYAHVVSFFFLAQGGGSAGAGAVEQLRESGFKGAIVMLTSEPHLPIDRIKLSKSLKPDVSKILLRPEAFYREAGVTVRTSTTVTSVDTDAQTVTLASGEVVAYDKLLLAPGAGNRL